MAYSPRPDRRIDYKELVKSPLPRAKLIRVGGGRQHGATPLAVTAQCRVGFVVGNLRVLSENGAPLSSRLRLGCLDYIHDLML